MNRLYISGRILEKPALRVLADGTPHLIFELVVRHKTKEGVTHREIYRVNAWHQAAEYGARQLRQGQHVVLRGYLTQNHVKTANVLVMSTEIVAQEFWPVQMLQQDEQTRIFEKVCCEPAAAS